MARLKVPVSKRTEDGFTSAYRPRNEAMECRHWAAGLPDAAKAWAKLGQYQGTVALGYYLGEV